MHPKFTTPKNARSISNIQQHFVMTQNLKESPCLTCAGPDDLRLLKQLLSSSATYTFSASFSVAKMSRVAVAAISAFCRFSPISLHHQDGMQPAVSQRRLYWYPLVQFRTHIVSNCSPPGENIEPRYPARAEKKSILMNLAMTKYWLEALGRRNHMPFLLLQPITKGCES